MSRRKHPRIRRRRRKRRRNTLLVVVGLAVVVTAVGGATAVSFTSGTVDRGVGVGVADSDGTGVIGLEVAQEVQSGADSQEFLVLTNGFDSQATFTVEITGQVARENVDFSSTGSDMVEVTVGSGDSVTLFVDVDNGAHNKVTTVDFVVVGGTDDDTVSVSLEEREGPEVVNPGGGGDNPGNSGDNPGNGG